MIRPCWNEGGIWPDKRMLLKIVARISVSTGWAKIRCSLDRLSGPAALPRGRDEIMVEISVLSTRSGSE